MMMRIGQGPSLLSVAIASTCLCVLAQEPQPKDSGPANIVITYRATPGKRIAFHEQMLKTGLARFEKWKKDGVLEDYRLLFNSYVDADTWDMLSILTFHEYQDVERWRGIERSMPGGLTAQEMALASPVNTYLMDRAWHGASSMAKSDPANSVFFVIPYVYTVPVEEYLKYAGGYVIPQADGWLKEGVLASYAIYVNRYPTLRPWQVLFVLEYKDWQSFGLRDKVVAKVRADLRQNPAWKALSDSKQKIRTEGQTAIAEQLMAR
jgi:hypothetical protein